MTSTALVLAYNCSIYGVTKKNCIFWLWLC